MKVVPALYVVDPDKKYVSRWAALQETCKVLTVILCTPALKSPRGSTRHSLCQAQISMISASLAPALILGVRAVSPSGTEFGVERCTFDCS